MNGGKLDSIDVLFETPYFEALHEYVPNKDWIKGNENDFTSKNMNAEINELTSKIINNP
jgi:hypothetical protein